MDKNKEMKNKKTAIFLGAGFDKNFNLPNLEELLNNKDDHIKSNASKKRNLVKDKIKFIMKNYSLSRCYSELDIVQKV
ncbi:MAG: hypothetical protein K4H23_02005 [Mollicutes bacterium PWAP]|nr:hypothetical protein [Mollicutes bacterium PWAP]